MDKDIEILKKLIDNVSEQTTILNNRIDITNKRIDGIVKVLKKIYS